METEVVAARYNSFIYVMSFGGYFKIGRSKDAQVRLRQIVAVKFPESPVLRLVVAVSDAAKAEKALHLKYGDRRVSGEWFRLTDEDLSEIEVFTRSGTYLIAVPKPAKPRTVSVKVVKDSRIPEKPRQPTQWNRKIDLAPKPSLKELPRLLREMTKEIDAVTFARHPYEHEDASAALAKIAKREGYNLTVFWDGPFNATVFKLPPGKTLFEPAKPNGNGHK
jgi:hypothetical protein